MSSEDIDLYEEVRTQLLEKMQEKGLEVFFQDMMEFICIEVMKMERAQFLNSEPYERSQERSGSRNGFQDLPASPFMTDDRRPDRNGQ